MPDPSADLASLEPRPLWRYFLGLSAIPRMSGHEAAALRWVVDQGRALGLHVEQDAVGNVLVRKPATPGCEHAPVTCLQGHVDMVCEKNEGTDHDFLKDPIRVRRDGAFLTATGTTLGADNGIGVATGLAVLAATDVRHGPLEVLITVDEETGLTGANALRPGWLSASILLNLDSEEEGFLTIGCAGGVDTIATRPVVWETAPAGLVSLRLKASGLKGGHSGGDIHLGRCNAIRLLAQALAAVKFGGATLEPGATTTGIPLRLGVVRGGNKRNAIPREATAVLFVAPADVATLRARITELEAAWRAAYGAFDPGLSLTLDDIAPTPVMPDPDADAFVRLLLALPHGVEAMSPDIPGLVQTSTNLGVVSADGTNPVEICLLTRSSIDSSKRALVERIGGTCALAGFTTTQMSDYPGWKPEPGTELVRRVETLWRERTGRELKVVAIHAGLECGIIGEKYPGMQMVSFGPDMAGAHTPEERVDIASVGRFWDLLVALLERIAA